MADESDTTNNESGPELHDCPAQNAAVERCLRAYKRAYAEEIEDLDEDDDREPARHAGREAYLWALPPLAGYENIRDFIAAITFADLAEIIRHYEAQRFLDCAKIAISAARHEPNHEPRRLGRPPKNPLPEENK